MKTLYINGCSFSHQSDGKNYGEFISEKLQLPVINRGMSRSCNSRIIRTSLRDLIKLKSKNKDVIALISLSFLVRTEVWDKIRSNSYDINDGDFASYQFFLGQNWFEKFKTGSEVNGSEPSYLKKYGTEWIKLYDPESEITNLLCNLIMFTSWCDQHNIDYLIYCGGDPLDNIDITAPFIAPFYNVIVKNPNIIDLFNFSFRNFSDQRGHVPYDFEEYGKYGHPGESAHKDFAEWLIDNYLLNFANKGN